MKRAIFEHEVEIAGRYTQPRTWGTYDLGSRVAGTHRFRHGNHPIRMKELKREYGNCSMRALFLSKSDAEQLAKVLNDGKSHLIGDQ